MVKKNKDLPDSAAHPQSGLSLSLSLADAIHPEGTLDPAEAGPWQNWCFQTMLLEKIFESPLVSKEIKPVNPKGNQPWIFIGTTDAEVEAPILWAPDVKSWLIGKKSDAEERLKAGREEDDRGQDD